MSEDLTHLDAAHRAHAGLSADERIEWIRQDRWIHYARADQVLARLTDLLTYPPRDRMPCLLLFGATGMGKTRIVHKFLREHRSSFDDRSGRTRLPVAVVQLPPTPTERHFYEELLISMGAVFPLQQSVSTLRHRTRALARQLEVRMLIIDEIHAMLAGTYREQRVLLNNCRSTRTERHHE
jgi:Cdc6-like AAA superfamily ATPase